MWAFTKYGFFSVVRKNNGMHVRARDRSHMESLIDAVMAEFPAIESPPLIEVYCDADYRWRIILPPIGGDGMGWDQVADTMALAIDYDNFKNDQRRFGADWCHLLAGIWSELWHWQTRLEQPVKPPAKRRKRK
jgi:hypothetical protein